MWSGDMEGNAGKVYPGQGSGFLGRGVACSPGVVHHRVSLEEVQERLCTWTFPEAWA